MRTLIAFSVIAAQAVVSITSRSAMGLIPDEKGAPA